MGAWCRNVRTPSLTLTLESNNCKKRFMKVEFSLNISFTQDPQQSNFFLTSKALPRGLKSAEMIFTN